MTEILWLLFGALCCLHMAVQLSRQAAEDQRYRNSQRRAGDLRFGRRRRDDMASHPYNCPECRQEPDRCTCEVTHAEH